MKKNRNKSLFKVFNCYLLLLVFLFTSACVSVSAEENQDNLFKEGFIIASNDGKSWGFLNEDGEFAFDQKFDSVRDFNSELAAVQVGDKWGYIDTTGTFVIEPKYFSVNDFNGDRAYVSELKDEVISSYFIDRQGNFVFDVSNHYGIRGFYNNIAFIRVVKRDGYQEWKCVDKFGNQVTDNVYCNLKDYKNGMVGVRLRTESGKFWGFLYDQGQLAIPCQYDKIKYFHNGLAAVKRGDKWGFVNKNGKIVIKIKYDNVYSFSDGIAAVKKGNKWGFVNSKGKVIVKPKFSRVNSCSEGLASVKYKGKWGYINKKGKFAIKPTFKKNYGKFSSGLAGVAIGKKTYQFINKKGKVVLKLDQFYKVGEFKKGRAPVTLDSDSFEHNYINKKGKLVYKGIYQDVSHFRDDNYTIAMINDYYYILDRNCNELSDNGFMYLDGYNYYAGGYVD